MEYMCGFIVLFVIGTTLADDRINLRNKTNLLDVVSSNSESLYKTEEYNCLSRRLNYSLHDSLICDPYGVLNDRESKNLL